MTNDEYHQKMNELNEKISINKARQQRVIARQAAALRKENRLFDKKRTHFLIQLGAEWLRIANEKVTPDSNLESLLQSEIEYMEMINRFLPRCPKCKKGVLVRKQSLKNPNEFYWFCSKRCGIAPVLDKDGHPALEKK